MEGNTVTIVPAGLIWKAYSRRRLISTSSVRVECERRAVFLGWTVSNPTYPALPPSKAKREAQYGLAMLAAVEDPTTCGLFQQLQALSFR